VRWAPSMLLPLSLSLTSSLHSFFYLHLPHASKNQIPLSMAQHQRASTCSALARRRRSSSPIMRPRLLSHPSPRPAASHPHLHPHRRFSRYNLHHRSSRTHAPPPFSSRPTRCGERPAMAMAGFKRRSTLLFAASDGRRRYQPWPAVLPCFGGDAAVGGGVVLSSMCGDATVGV
jgi:hypothetical protein